MARHPLARHYEQLNPRQRLQLILAAERRQDHAEAERLVEACPQHVYRMADAVFVDAQQAMFQINVAILGDIHRLLAEYRAVKRMCSAMLPLMKLAAMETEEMVFQDAAAEMAPVGSPVIDPSVTPQLSKASEAAGDDVSQMIDGFCREHLPRTTTAVEKLRRHISEGILSRLHGILTGYDRFCRRVLDMPATEVLRALAPEIIKEIESLPETAEAGPDEDQADRTDSLLVQIWSRLCG